MEKALKMGQVSATGSLKIFIGKSVSTIILAVGTIVLARLILPADYGLYSIALTPVLMISLFQDLGMGSAMTKYIAHLRARSEDDDLYYIIWAGLTFEISTGIVLSFTSLFLAGFVASTILHRPISTPLISIASITVFSTSLLTASQSCFTGFDRMELSSLTMICQSVVQTTISPMLVLIGYGALGAVLGYTTAFLAAGVVGIIALYFIFLRKLKRTNKSRSQMLQILRPMLHYGFPLSISAILGGFMTQFYGFVIAFFCNDVMIGNYRVALNFATLLTFFTIPIATVLFPTFAKLDPQNEPQLLKTIFLSSVKYTTLFLVPATMAVMVLSGPMINTLFGEKWNYAPLFLTIHSTNYLLTLFGNLSLWSLLAGLGETRMSMKLSFLTLIFGIPLALLLIPTFGIVGAMFGNLLAGLPSMVWGLHWILKRYNVRADFKSSIKIATGSAVAALIAFASLSFVSTTEWMKLTIAGTIFLAIFLFTVPLIGAITQNDINALRSMFSGLGFVSKLINVPISLIEKALILFHRSAPE